ncbi:MAG: hypothetical protein GY804_09405 [Alphaproteobacteria bacterium]|nr:hypothetical protein [Alphaproteobacteria bacterium]
MKYKNIKHAFETNFDFEVTPGQVRQIELYVHRWELKKEHPLTLGSAYLGIYTVSFVESVDGGFFFNLFNTNFNEVSNVIRYIQNIDLSRSTRTNPFNLFMLWIYYKIIISKSLSDKLKEIGTFNSIKMLIYKFFSGSIRTFFQHPPNKEIFDYTLNKSLDRKSDIIQLGTWKNVIEYSARNFLAESSIHDKTMLKFYPDEKVFYALTNTYGKTRSRVFTIAKSFYNNHETGKTMKTTSLTFEAGGEKVIKSITGLENLLSTMRAQLPSVTAFRDHNDIRQTCNIIKRAKAEALIRAVTNFSEEALVQTRQSRSEFIQKINGREYIVNVNKLMGDYLLCVYNHCMLDKVNLRQPLMIIKKFLDIFTSSQMKDEKVLLIKRSFDKFIKDQQISRRSATIVNLRNGLMVYILIKSFRFLTVK